MTLPRRVVIVGGTHGNEWTGVQIVRHYQEHFTTKFPKLAIEFIFANPEAHALNSRFKDEDLNRAFEFLGENRTTHEHKRAFDIQKQLKSSPCVVLDLHTTTANMGKTVIVSHYNSFNFSICAQVQKKFSDCRIIGAPDPHQKYLASQSEHGLILEVGPLANGVVAAETLKATIDLLESILDFLSDFKTAQDGSVELFEETQDVHYPTNEKGELNAYIHTEFQGTDFQEIEGEFVPFSSFSGVDIMMKTDEKLFPIFINEAAYYRTKLAFTLCRKRNYSF